MGLRALAVMVALSGAPELAADAVRCETRSEREPSDIVVPLADRHEPERFVFQLGTRVGWFEQLGSGGWQTDEDEDSRDLRGPSLDFSGPRWRLVLGIGV